MRVRAANIRRSNDASSIGLFPAQVRLVIRPWRRPPFHLTERKPAGPGPLRRAELAAGRACARAALASLGIRGAPLPSLLDGVVAWPAAVVGSIAHTDGCCGAAVAWREDVAGIGFDIERRAGIPSNRWPLFCLPSELEWLRGTPQGEAEQRARMLFALKESAFKAASSALPRLDPAEIEIQLEMEAGHGAFIARLPSPPTGISIRGRFAVTPGFIFAGAFVC